MMSAPPLSSRPRTLAGGMRVAGAMALSLLLASCSALGLSKDGSSQGGSTGQADPSIAAAAPEGLKDFYSQTIVWKPCEDKLQCAKVKVPVDYAKPDGDTSYEVLTLTRFGRFDEVLLVTKRPGAMSCGAPEYGMVTRPSAG